MGQLSGCPFCLRNIPSLNKSTYGFCGHKCRMALRGSSAGASLPSSPRFPLQHFCRAKTPQDFSARENQMMARKRTPAYWRMPRTMTQSALICTAEKRVYPCQAKVCSWVYYSIRKFGALRRSIHNVSLFSHICCRSAIPKGAAPAFFCRRDAAAVFTQPDNNRPLPPDTAP